MWLTGTRARGKDGGRGVGVQGRGAGCNDAGGVEREDLPSDTIVRMVDPLTSLAFSVGSGKDMYALLLGSGVSTVAGIPTGWDITVGTIFDGALRHGG
jgi:hypothetical protein